MALLTQSARGTRLACRATSSGNGQAFRLSVSVREAPQPAGPSAPAVAGYAAMGLAAVLVLKKLSDKFRPSNRLDIQSHRGQNGFRRDIFASDVMKNVNTTPMPSLSEAQIAAARERRLKERGDEKFTLEDIELPDNHPWATRATGKKQGAQDSERVRAPLPKRREKPPVSPQFLDESDDLPPVGPRTRAPRDGLTQGTRGL